MLSISRIAINTLWEADALFHIWWNNAILDILQFSWKHEFTKNI